MGVCTKQFQTKATAMYRIKYSRKMLVLHPLCIYIYIYIRILILYIIYQYPNIINMIGMDPN
jgi:hypothetical protein